MEQDIAYLGEEDLRLYRAMRRWHNEVGGMLAYVNDVLVPHGFDDIVQGNFAVSASDALATSLTLYVYAGRSKQQSGDGALVKQSVNR